MLPRRVGKMKIYKMNIKEMKMSDKGIPSHLLDKINEARLNPKSSVLFPYRLEDEPFYNEIGKMGMFIHYSYNFTKCAAEQFKVQISVENPCGVGRHQIDRMKYWCDETKATFNQYCDKLR